jgi:hypothetical protein
MNANNDDISHRLRASLGGNEAPTLGADIVTGAAERPAPHIVNRGRRAVAAGGLTLVAAAAVTTALVVTSPFQQAPLFTAAGSTSTESSAMSADSRLMIWTNYEYVPGDSLSTDSGNGHVYQLQRVGTAEDVLVTVAKAFDLAGEPVKSAYYDPAYPSYVIGAEDGTAPSVVVSWSGSGNWWYNDPSAYPQTTACEGYSGDPAVEVPVCEVFAPTENLAPSESEARSIARELFAATGLDVEADAIRVTADEWQTVATASLTVDGTETALDWSVGWSATGTISFAYGHSIKVVDKGSYGTVSAHDAVGRLADWRWFGSAGPEYQGGMNMLATDTARSAEGPDTAVTSPTTEVPATEPPVAEEPTAEPAPIEEVPGEAPTTEPVPEPTLIDPVPVEPLPTPETIVVTVDEAHATLLLLWDADGNAWLVPGFAMPHPDGWFNSVVSLVDGVITLPEPMAIEPYLLED